MTGPHQGPSVNWFSVTLRTSRHLPGNGDRFVGNRERLICDQGFSAASICDNEALGADQVFKTRKS
jgi:hypothetical protein